jgi:hypothetical protein
MKFIVERNFTNVYILQGTHFTIMLFAMNTKVIYFLPNGGNYHILSILSLFPIKK